MPKTTEPNEKLNQRRLNHITWKYSEYCNAAPHAENKILQELLDYIGDICEEEGVEV